MVCPSRDMVRLSPPLNYLANLTPGRVTLWCYLIWYLVSVVVHFDNSLGVWLNSLGISAVIGIALLLSIGHESAHSSSRWQTFRFFLMPFCVSSFSALIKGQGYILVFPSQPFVLSMSLALCALFVICVYVLKRSQRGVRA
jgi:hypothetical protein